MERLHGDIRDFKIYNFELNEKDTKELHRNITIKKQRDEMLEMLHRIENILTYDTIEPNLPLQEEIYNLIKQATEL